MSSPSWADAPTTIAAGATVNLQVRFTPGTTVGQRTAKLTLTGDGSVVEVGLYGLSMTGIEGANESPLDQVLGTLGYNVNVGWTNLEVGMDPGAKGEEVLEPLFVKSGTAPVTWKALAHFAPPEAIPFGWYTGDGTAAERHEVGAIDGTNVVGGGYQTPAATRRPAEARCRSIRASVDFGFYYYSASVRPLRVHRGSAEQPAPHRARIYPAKNRAGVAIPNTYIVAFEDASNGDYQDYVFLVSGIKPVTETGSGTDAIKVDFTTAAGDLAAGYIRDYGQAYGPRTGAGQGSGLTYGWKNQATEVDVDLSVGGTTPGNGRDRQSSQTDIRLDSFMHMQPTDVAGTFNGTQVDAFWELALPNGSYDVTVGVGDPNVGSDVENPRHQRRGSPARHGLHADRRRGIRDRATRSRRRTVEVTDGALTLDALGGTNTKIGFVDVVPVGGDRSGRG